MIFHRGLVQPADAFRFFLEGRAFAARGGADTSPRWYLGFFSVKKGRCIATSGVYMYMLCMYNIVYIYIYHLTSWNLNSPKV